MNENRINITIVSAAIRLDGEVYTLPRPARHADIIRDMCKTVNALSLRLEYGFILSNGNFADRKAALQVALLTGQVTRERLSNPGHGLFTDDVW